MEEKSKIDEKAHMADEEIGKDTSQEAAVESTGTSKNDVPASSENSVHDLLKEEIEQLRRTTEEQQKKIKELQDQYIRSCADVENTRKRLAKEKGDAIAHANNALLLDILESIDDLESAIRAGEQTKNFEALHQGIALIEQRLIDMLQRKWGVERFDANEEPFDPYRHEAVAIEEVEGVEPSIVIEDYRRGYMLHDRVLRPARVKVSK